MSNNNSETIVKEQKPIKLTVEALLSQVFTLWKEYPETKNYEIYFMVDPAKGDLTCMAADLESKDGFTLFSNCDGNFEFSVGFNFKLGEHMRAEIANLAKDMKPNTVMRLGEERKRKLNEAITADNAERSKNG